MVHCPLCSHTFDCNLKVPRLIPCDRTVCHSCIAHLIEESNDSFQCPLCQEIHAVQERGVKAFMQNKQLVTLLKKQKKQEQVGKNQSNQTTYESCEDHDMENNLFCREQNCREIICSECAISKHEEHEIVGVRESKTVLISNILKDIKIKKSIVTGVKNNLGENLRKTISDIQAERDIWLKRLTDAFDSIEKEAVATKMKTENVLTKKLKNIDKYEKALADYSLDAVSTGDIVDLESMASVTGSLLDDLGELKTTCYKSQENQEQRILNEICGTLEEKELNIDMGTLLDQTVKGKMKYTNPARGILDFWKQKFWPLPIHPRNHIFKVFPKLAEIITEKKTTYALKTPSVVALPFIYGVEYNNISDTIYEW